MRIVLKHIHIAPWASAESTAFTAAVYFDNTLIGQVSNTGDGPGHQFSGDQSAYALMQEWCNTALGRMDFSDLDMPTTLDGVFARQIEFHEERQRILKLMEGNVLSINPMTGDLTVHSPLNRLLVDEKVCGSVRRTLPDGEYLLNDGTADEAVLEVMRAERLGA